jgi:hypothetical protein
LVNGKILCVDLGTSSMRAAVRVEGRVDARVLELGEAFRSSIDAASIPSAIFVPQDLSMLYFGEHALARGLRGESAHLFDTSPKTWMNTGPLEQLDAEVLPGTSVTRKHLLAGLLAQAFSASRQALAKSRTDPIQIEIRVAHPVWDSGRESSLREALGWITAGAVRLAGTTDGPVEPKSLAASLQDLQWQQQLDTLDVVEPVAAALQLFENSQNAREICAVIDVGAGSTDMAIFLSLTPDARGYGRKFRRAAPARSVYIAGDFIDGQVLDLIRTKAGRISEEGFRSLELRRRQIKETLFSRAGRIFEAGVEITLRELESEPGIHRMRDQIGEAFRQLVSESSGFLSPFVTARMHRAGELNVIFAGGGSKIAFLHHTIGTSARIGGQVVPIRIRRARSTSDNLPTSLERLAVALGGTIPAEHWPVTTEQDGEWVARKRRSL